MNSKHFSESNFKNLNIVTCDKIVVAGFLKIINGETVGEKVSTALTQRHQGHFDKAMLNISEANRDQVIAIREAQFILDKLAGRTNTEVIFEKYRQTIPFQIGVTNGEEVLNIVSLIQSAVTDSSITLSELHENEVKLQSLNEEFTFISERMKDRLSETEIEAMKNELSELSSAIFSMKEMVVHEIFSIIARKMRDINGNDLLNLVKNFYLIVTSSIETLDAKDVEV